MSKGEGIVHRRLSELSPDFQDFMREMYAKRGWPCPENVHVNLKEVARRMNKRPDALRAADEFFDKNLIVAEKPKEIRIHHG